MLNDAYADKRAAAIEYLRSRNKYLLDGCEFTPTSSVNTNIAATFAEYLGGMRNG